MSVYLAADFRKFQNENAKIQQSTKIQNTAKISKYDHFLLISWKFSKFGAKDFAFFSNFDMFSGIYSGRSRKMKKKGKIRAKFRVDTADILIF